MLIPPRLLYLLLKRKEWLSVLICLQVADAPEEPDNYASARSEEQEPLLRGRTDQSGSYTGVV